MQVLLTLVALPAVALLLALASRLEDGLRAPAVPVRSPDDLDALDGLGALAVPDIAMPVAEPVPSALSPGH